MRRAHLWTGLVTVAVFLISGQMMRHHQPPLAAMSDGSRLVFRSRHIYILASGLVNLMPGLYFERLKGRRGVVQAIGSGLLLLSTALLMLAFGTETARPFDPEMPWSHLGLYALFGGAMLHWAASVGRRR